MAIYSKILELIGAVPRNVDLSTNTLSMQGLQINAASGGTSITHDFNSGGTSYIVTWPASQASSSGYALLNDGAGNLSWAPASAGSVTSVAFSDASTTPIYSISGSPVTSSGTLTQTLTIQSANTVFAGPATGSAAQPTFRALVSADIPSLSAIYVTQSEVGAVNGVASLDSGGHIPLSQLPASLVEYQGTWAASTNTPTLANGTGTSGWFYIASNSGTVNFGAGGIAFNAGDWVLYNGTIWERAVQSNVVQSVNSQTGIVTINAINQLTGDITAGPASGSASAAASLVATTNATLATLSALTTASSLASVGTITSGTWNGTAVGPTHGGTGLTSYTTGDTLYASASNVLSKLGIGSTGNVLTVVGGVPAWAAPATGGTVTSVSVSTANGVSGSVATATTTPAITLTLGAITPTSVNGNTITTGTGTLTLSTHTVTAAANATISGTNTGDQTITLTGNVTGSGTGSFATTIANNVVSAAMLTTGIADQVTITGGNGTALSVVSAPATAQTLVAGQTFTANTSYAVRWGLTANGETAGRVYAADITTSSFDLFYVIGMASSAAGATAGGNILVTRLGSFALSSADTAFASNTDGAPVFLTATGTFSVTAPSTSGQAITRIGVIKTRSATVTSNVIDVSPQTIGVN